MGTTIGALSSLEFGFDSLAASLAAGGINNSFVQMDNITLKTASVIDFESISSLAILIDAVSPSTGETIRQPLNIQVQDLVELSAPVRVGDGTAQRSVVNRLVLSFDQSVTVDAGAFNVSQRVKNPQGQVSFNPITTNYTLAADGKSVTLTFSGALTMAGSGGLLDGNYQLTVYENKIRSSSSNLALDANRDGTPDGEYLFGAQRADNFFALLGDANGNGEVDAQDLLGAKLALRKTIGQAGYSIAYDINGNGVVDAQDILNIQLNLRKKRMLF